MVAIIVDSVTFPLTEKQNKKYMNSVRFQSQIRQGRGEYNKLQSQSSQSLGLVPSICQRQLLAREACILAAELSRLTKLHYVSKGDGREWFRYRFQTSRF